MQRYKMRQPTYPPSLLPQRIRASTLAYTYWCDEQARLKILGLVPEEEENEAMFTGTAMHKVLEESCGRRFTWENDFMQKLEEEMDKNLGFVRKAAGVDIYADLSGHPDDLQILKDFTVSIVEYKTTANPNIDFIEHWKLPVSSFQVQIYCFILEPIIVKLGGHVHRVHAVSYYNSKTFDHIQDFDSIWRPQETERTIRRALGMIANPCEAIAPASWKCRYCSEENKKVCQFWQRNLEQGKA